MNVRRSVNSDVSASSVASENLQATINEAVRHFEQAFGPLHEEIKIDTKSSSCMRVGYDYINKVVNFCDTNQVINQGADSVDVIRHEVFHAMLCQKMPDICDRQFLTSTDHQALHEGLADFFAFTLAPDQYFGEKFYKDKTYIREYRAGFCYSLVKGYHEKGNVLVSKLIERRANLSDIARKLEAQNFLPADYVDSDSCFLTEGAPSFSLVPSQGGESNFNRYRIPLNKPLHLIPKFNEAFRKKFKNVKVTFEWPTSSSFTLTEAGENQFMVQAVKEGPFIDAVMSVYSDGVIIGRSKYYFALTDSREMSRESAEKNN